MLVEIRAARSYRIIETNSAETQRLIAECQGLSGPEWMERQDRITELFAEHKRLCEVFGKVGE
ncbi:MAG: hypothetical protein PHX83_06585 [Acidobacteriia bacterium]|nr:hypothetical protein [Terriglobia bacterium]